MDGRKGAAYIQTNQRRLGRAERTLRLEPIGERTAFHEFHPDADLAIDVVGAIHGDDVRVTNAGESPRLCKHLRLVQYDARRRPEELHGNFAVELGIARAIDRCEGAGPNGFEEHEMTPPIA